MQFLFVTVYLMRINLIYCIAIDCSRRVATKKTCLLKSPTPAQSLRLLPIETNWIGSFYLIQLEAIARGAGLGWPSLFCMPCSIRPKPAATNHCNKSDLGVRKCQKKCLLYS